jgi:hypothetical protein
VTAAGSQSSASTVGIIVNPAAGKDIRRLVSAASPTSDMAKVGIVRRAVIGAIEGGAERVLLSDDRRSLSARAIDRLDTEAELDLLPTPPWDVGRNSTVAAMLLRDEEVGAVIVLGGDGTHRDVVKGWRHAPLVALSTGTNNVFPRHYEATVAGHAAAVVATGVAQLDDVSWQAKVLDVEVGATDDAEAEADLALVDLAHVDSSFTASRAVWEAGRLKELVATIAEPASVGLSAVAARLAPVSRREPGAVHVTCSGPNTETHRVPIAPGLYGDVAVSDHRRIGVGDVVTMCGPGVLSFDGERDVVLSAGRQAFVTVAPDGPSIIDVTAAMAATARTSPSPLGDHDHNR